MNNGSDTENRLVNFSMRHPRILLILALFSVSTAAVFARFIPAVPAVSIGLWRMVFAAVILWGFHGLKRQASLSPESRKYVLLAGIALGVHFACYFGALKFTTVAAATLLSTMSPVFTVIFEYIILRRPWNRSVLGGVFLALMGALLVQFSAIAGFSQFLLGNSLGVAASLCMALVLMVSEKIRRVEGALTFSRTIYAVAAVFLLLLTFALRRPVFSFSPEAYFWLFLLGLVPTVIGHTSFYYAIKWLSPTVVASVPLGEPIMASVWAWIFFLERPSPRLVAGGVLILAGLYYIMSKQEETLTPDTVL